MITENKNLIIQPWTERLNRLDNRIYEFIFIGSKKQKYYVNIEVNEIKDDNIISTSCMCADHQFRIKECKHIKEAIRQLKIYGVIINGRTNTRSNTRTDEEENNT